MLKQAIRAALAFTPVGATVAAALRVGGKKHLARRVSLKYGTRVPPVIDESLPRALFEKPHLRMVSVNGTDQVARRIWTNGWEAFEAPMPRLFAVISAQAVNVLDVGANTGLYSLLAASTSTTVKVHAFEPLPAALKPLRLNVDLNDLGSRITVNPAAVGQRPGQATLYLPHDDHGLIETSASLNASFRDRHDATMDVPVVTIDGYCQELTGVDLIKLDVEGFEEVALAGALHTIRKHRPVIAIEVLDDAPEIEAARVEHDYIAVRMYRDHLAVSSTLAVDQCSPNQLLWPREQIQRLNDLSTKAGIPIRR